MTRTREHVARVQRAWRAQRLRIDYIPSPAARALIEAERPKHHGPGCTVDAIVLAWGELTGRWKRPTLPEFRHTSQARAGAYDFGYAAALQRTEARLAAKRMTSAKRAGGTVRQSATAPVRCGARRHRDGQPCEARPEPGKSRCRFHGGRSTGPRTPEGKARALANLRQFQRP